MGENSGNLLSYSSGSSRSPKSRRWQGHALLKALGKKSSLLLSGFSEVLAILGVPWLVNSSLQSLPLLSHGILPPYLCVLKFPSYKGTKAHLLPQLNVITSATTPFPNKVTLKFKWTYVFARYYSAYTGSLENILLNILNPFKLNVVQTNTPTEIITITSQAPLMAHLYSFNK